MRYQDEFLGADFITGMLEQAIQQIFKFEDEHRPPAGEPLGLRLHPDLLVVSGPGYPAHSGRPLCSAVSAHRRPAPEP